MATVTGSHTKSGMKNSKAVRASQAPQAKKEKEKCNWLAFTGENCWSQPEASTFTDRPARGVWWVSLARINPVWWKCTKSGLFFMQSRVLVLSWAWRPGTCGMQSSSTVSTVWNVIKWRTHVCELGTNTWWGGFQTRPRWRSSSVLELGFSFGKWIRLLTFYNW